MKNNNLLIKGAALGITILFVGIIITSTTGYKTIEKRLTNSETLQDIDGLYYLRDDDPQGRNDVGSLMKNESLDNETIFCDSFILFRFAENGTYIGINRIFNIYYHLWQRAPTPDDPYFGEDFYIGYDTLGKHNGHMNESIRIDTRKHISFVDTFRLVKAMQITDPEIASFEGDEIYNFTIKSAGCFPMIRNFLKQYSFVIINLEDNATLQGYDRDGDYLNDYEELFVYITDPFDIDTDKDGATDYEEVNGASHGYQDSDPNDYTDTTDYRRVDAGGPYVGLINESIQFTGSVFSGSPPYSWHWDFGDGNTSYGQNTSHMYSATGNYTVTLNIIDNESYSDFDITTATIGYFNVKIAKPEKAFYFNNKKIIPVLFSIKKPIVIGSIDLEVDATDIIFGVNKVEFYIDDQLKATDTTYPYSYMWDEKTPLKFRYEIKALTYNNAGNSTSDEIMVWKFF